jgi:hypothetical protein
MRRSLRECGNPESGAKPVAQLEMACRRVGEVGEAVVVSCWSWGRAAKW